MKKRKSATDGNATSKRRKHKGAVNLLRMRADSRTTFNDENGEKVPLKTAAIVNPKKVTITDGRDVNFSYDHISSDRPMTVTEFSLGGSPVKGVTPGRTTMYRAENSSILSIFTNSSALQANADGTPLRQIQNTFEQSSAYKAVRSKDQDSYMQTIQINAEQLQKVRLEIEEKGCSRNQNQVMKKKGEKIKKAGATHYANSAKINDAGVSWEWLHKIAFRFIGRDGQVPENLGCGTAYANTDMLLIESALPQLTELIPDGFTLTVNAHYIKSTSILTKIDYIVNLDGNEYKACFNAQRQTKPLIAGYEYHHSFFKQLAEGKFPDEAVLTPKEEEEAMQRNTRLSTDWVSLRHLTSNETVIKLPIAQVDSVTTELKQLIANNPAFLHELNTKCYQPNHAMSHAAHEYFTEAGYLDENGAVTDIVSQIVKRALISDINSQLAFIDPVLPKNITLLKRPEATSKAGERNGPAI